MRKRKGKSKNAFVRSSADFTVYDDKLPKLNINTVLNQNFDTDTIEDSSEENHESSLIPVASGSKISKEQNVKTKKKHKEQAHQLCFVQCKNIKPELKAWDESDDECTETPTSDNSDNEPGIELKSSNNILKSKNLNHNKAKNYSVDIWYILSTYIRPEDIGKFALICKTSYSVINSARFWRSVYRRYYKWDCKLPTQLRPECLYRAYGLKTLVIRALFHMYNPFNKRFEGVKVAEHPIALKSRQCVLMWHQRRKDRWSYYFKLKEYSYNVRVQGNFQQKHDLLDLLEDVTANSEEDCRILQITSPNFIPVNPIQGLYLSSASVTLSKNLRDVKVLLTFNSGLIYNNDGNKAQDSVNILLDSVSSIKILNWWHPLYPHSYNIDILRIKSEHAES